MTDPHTFGEGWSYFWRWASGEFTPAAWCGFTVALSVFSVSADAMWALLKWLVTR